MSVEKPLDNANYFSGALMFSPKTSNKDAGSLFSHRSGMMDDLQNIYGSLGGFKTGLTPRSGLTPLSNTANTFRTGLTPRSGLTPLSNTSTSFSTGLTPKNTTLNVSSISNSGSIPNSYSFTNSLKESTKGIPTIISATKHKPNSLPKPLKSTLSRPKKLETSTDAHRRMKNRERVRKCRKRKQDRLLYLENRNEELEKENRSLRAKLTHYGDEVCKEMDENEKASLYQNQLQTLETLKQSINAGTTGVDSVARLLWCPEGQIALGGCGHKVSGVEEILIHEKAMLQALSLYNVETMEIQPQPSTENITKMSVSFVIQAVLAKALPKECEDMPSISPFSTLCKYLGGEQIRFEYVSHFTFKDGKILEDIRVLDTIGLLSGLLSKHQQNNPAIVAEITQAIASCRQ